MNADGSVNFTDFLVLSQNFGSSGNWDDGDFSNDGMVTFGDFLDLSDNFGSVGITRRANPVPEPSSNLIAFIAIVAIFSRRRSR